MSTEVSHLASPTGDIDTLRTPGVARDQEYTERGMYAENILAFDARLLQDIISGRCSQQQMYGSTPSWYRDSFMIQHNRGKFNMEYITHLSKFKIAYKPYFLT